MADMLSQEEIDALLGGGGGSDDSGASEGLSEDQKMPLEKSVI